MVEKPSGVMLVTVSGEAMVTFQLTTAGANMVLRVVCMALLLEGACAALTGTIITLAHQWVVTHQPQSAKLGKSLFDGAIFTHFGGRVLP